jgi:hypothetical protein
VRLAQGDWVEGFKGFRLTQRTKWRKERHYGATPETASVEWMGEPDATVIVTGEQGLGDEIMAAGVVLDAAKHCKRFIFDCDHRLSALFQRSFPNVLVVPGRREESLRLPVMPTHHKTLFGLSELFRHTDADFPRKPYLVPNAEYVGMFNSLADWLGKLPAKMYPIGKEIVLAIGRAIIDQAGTIYNNLWAILSSAVNGIGAKLGITIPGFGGSAPGAPGGSSGGTGGKGVGVGDQGSSFANSVASTGAGLGGLSIAGAGVAGPSVGVTINVAQMSSDFDLEQVGLYVANKIRGAITR